jgi:hypothetical protein
MTIPEEDRVYIDESGNNEYLQREYARAGIGSQIYGATSGLKFARESFIATKVQS